MNEQELRHVFETQIRNHILGPGLAKEIICCKEDASDEILDGDPKELYTTGVLYPKQSLSDGTEESEEQLPQNDSEPDEEVVLDDVEETSDDSEDDEGDSELEIDKKQQVQEDRNRASGSDHIGLITCLAHDCQQVKINLRYAKYRRLMGEELKKVKINLGYNFPQLKDLLAKYNEVEGNKNSDSYISIDEANKTISRKVVDYKPQYPKIEGELVELNYVFKKLFSPTFYQREEKTDEFLITLSDNILPKETDDLIISFNFYQRKNKNGNPKRYLKVLVRNKNEHKGQDVQKAHTESCIFQLCVRVTPIEHKLITFTDPVNYVFDEENNETEYIYRKVKNYGKGVGCAVNWDANGEWIETAYIPFSDVKKFSNSLDKDYCDKLHLDEQAINNACKLINLSHWHKDDEEYINRLRQFVAGYGSWIEKQRIEANEEPQYETIYKTILDKQDVLLRRLEDNVNYLEDNPIALECFQLANTAMLIQMAIAHNPLFKKNRDVAEISETSDVLNNIDFFKANQEQTEPNRQTSYRPFQLAFLLMNVKSTFEEDDEFRKKYVDLIWFPTGGGKTEAYLALTALTIIGRRKTAKSDDEANGVSVIMRYTLRLLTTQQFERASYLICALEFMRQQEGIDIGKGGQITIGRWIGKEKGNKRKNFLESLSEGKKEKTNPYPVTYCPWCGGKLVRDIEEDGSYKHGYINAGDTQCLNDNCHFISLPIQYVDDELYRNPPTLLLATVDKFANLYKMDAAKMLGYGTKALSPDLIIQDELHLISGPLGSMVGFFEMIVELMASKGGHRPKIIASTATTRNTSDQISKLYNKEVNVFPAQGITYDDNFFSHVEKKEALRRHIGICPQAYPVKAEIRIIAQLILAKISLIKAYLKDKGIGITNVNDVSEALINKNLLEKEHIDPYWTLVLYYNSLKDLGRTRSRISQEIFENLRTQKRYLLIPSTLDFVWSGIDKRVQEFTSRMDSSQIKDMLTKAESQAGLFVSNKAHLIYEDESNLDLVLASNMISVGIDVARWNVMLMSGQPRSNSEYIQSSSRVARNHKGLVVNTYSPQRVREVSMFENFTSYHEAYYKYVEPLSLTPVTMQILKNDILNNVRKCYQNYISVTKEDKVSTLRSLMEELNNRFHLDDEIAEYARNEINSRWEEDALVSSLRDVDPNCWACIKGINYNKK